MANSSEPTPRLPFDEPAESACAEPDLPLASIPSIPEGPAPPPAAAESEGDGRGGYVLGGAAIFVLIVAISVLGARYLRLPESATRVAPVEERPLATALGREAAPAARTAAPAVLEQTPEVPATSGARAAAKDAEVLRLEQALTRSSASLLEAERTLAREREARRAAERKAQSAATGVKPEKDARAKARLQSLEAENLRLKKALRTREQTAAAGQAKAAEHERQVAELLARIAAAEQKAEQAEQASDRSRQSHEAAIRGENDAVRKLVSDLNRERDAAQTEKTARLEAEKRAQALEREVQRLRAGSASASSRPLPAPAAAPPVGRAEMREPERVKTVPPRYPDELRRAGVGGRVLLRVLVDEQGNVAEVQVKQSPDPRLSTIAADAARRWQYTPGRKDGQRSRMWITEAVDFKI